MENDVRENTDCVNAGHSETPANVGKARKTTRVGPLWKPGRWYLSAEIRESIGCGHAAWARLRESGMETCQPGIKSEVVWSDSIGPAMRKVAAELAELAAAKKASRKKGA